MVARQLGEDRARAIEGGLAVLRGAAEPVGEAFYVPGGGFQERLAAVDRLRAEPERLVPVHRHPCAHGVEEQCPCELRRDPSLALDAEQLLIELQTALVAPSPKLQGACDGERPRSQVVSCTPRRERLATPAQPLEDLAAIEPEPAEPGHQPQRPPRVDAQPPA